MAMPGGRADEFERGLLEGPRDEEAVDDLDGAEAFQDGAPGGEGADPQVGRGDLGERADVDDDAVGVVGGERGGERRRVLVDETAGEVVLDDEGSGGPGDTHDLTAPLGGEYRACRVLEEGLADEDPGPGGAERGFQELGADSVGVDGYGDGAQSGGAGDGEHARVGGRLDEDGGAGWGEGPQGGGDGGLTMRR